MQMNFNSPMIKMIIAFQIVLLLSGCSDSENKKAVRSVEDKTVYICTGSSASRYHLDRSCPGLAKCKHTITTTTLITAKKRGRTMCSLE